MKTIRIFLLSALITVLTLQCANDPKAEIKRLEKQMSDPGFKLDQEGMKTADGLINAYVDFAEKHKKSPEAPLYLFEAGNMAMNLNRSDEALELFNRIIYQYPEYEKSPESLFLMGYIYENNLQNYGKAKEIYQSFLDKYPDHEFADDARILIENIGRPLDELVKEFETQGPQN